MSEWLVQLWLNMTTEEVYTPWPLGFLSGILVESGVFNNDPLLTLMTNILEQFPERVLRKVVVAAVDVNSGNYVTFNETMPWD
jgi:Na+/H+ antiporter NhaD/arsenite permease-like protein